MGPARWKASPVYTSAAVVTKARLEACAAISAPEPRISVGAVVAIKMVVARQLDAMTTPVEQPPLTRPDDGAGTPVEAVREKVSRRSPVRRVVRRIVRPPPAAENAGGIVGRDVNDSRVLRDDRDVIIMDVDDLLCVAHQCARGLRLPAHTLYGVHDICLLRDERVTELLSPPQISAHAIEHATESA
jgi:hypothetical protein